MTENIFKHFEKELEYLYGAARTIALKYPQSSKSLGIDRVTPASSDPFLKQLLEGVAFLSARVHKRIDESSESYGRRLLEIVYPGLIAPVPSFAIVEMQPNYAMFIPEYPLQSDRLERGHVFTTRSDETDVTLVSCQSVELLPIQLMPTVVVSAASDYRTLWVDKDFQATHAVRFELTVPENIEFNMLNVDSLPIYIRPGSNAIGAAVPSVLQTLMLQCKGVEVISDGIHLSEYSSKPCLEQLGFDDTDALLPETNGVYTGDRLLREYFVFPERFNFFSLGNIQAAFNACAGRRLSVVAFVDAVDIDTATTTVEQIFQSVEFCLYSMPVVNLFPMSLETVEADHRNHEHFILPSKTERGSYEIHSVQQVVGNTAHETIEYSPYYSDFSNAQTDSSSYYSIRRESADVASQSAVSNHEIYQPSDIFLAIVDENNQYLRSDDPMQLSIVALCTNRALLVDGTIDLSRTSIESVEGSGFLSDIKLLDGPTKPASCLSDEDQIWQLVGTLSRNFRTLGGAANQDALAPSVQHLKSTLSLLSKSVGRGKASVIDGLLDIAVSRKIRSMVVEGIRCVGRGLLVTVKLDESVFPGGSTYLFCQIIERYLSRQVSINTFLEMVFVNKSGHEIARWEPRIGQLPVL